MVACSITLMRGLEVTAAMLEVYLLQQCIVVNLPVLADWCVRNYTPVENTVRQ